MQFLGLLHAAVGAAGGAPGLFRGMPWRSNSSWSSVRCASISRAISRSARRVRKRFANLKKNRRTTYAPSESSLSTSPDIRRQRSVSSASAFPPALVMA